MLYAMRVYATAVPSVCLSVHPFVHLSVTRMDCIKIADHIIKILSLSDRPVILVFHHQGLLRKSYAFTSNGGAEYKWDSGFRIFNQYHCISEIVIYTSE